MPLMKLFGHDTSPYVRRVRVLLRELGQPFTRDTMSWVAPSPEFVQKNPIARVPCLVDDDADDLTLLDSKLIATYLYDRRTRPAPAAATTQAASAAADPAQAGALPAPPPGHDPIQPTLFHPAHRYADENALLMIDAAIDSAINVFLLEQDGVSPTASPYLQRQMARMAACLSFLDARLEGQTSLHPGAFSFTDIALVCGLDWLRFRQRHDIARYPHLLAALARHQDRPALAETHPSLATSTAPPRTPR